MTEGWSARRTEISDANGGFGQLDSGLAWVGHLTPLNPGCCIAPTTLTSAGLMIGRSSESDLRVQDDNVSRQHARISRIGGQFVIEDLSSNGTFVDGVPVQFALLHDGDTIQIGSSLMFFDQRLVLGGEQGSPSEIIRWQDWHARRRDLTCDEMSFRFWGTRGSLPTPGAGTRKFGGNTACFEVRYGDTTIVFDAGSGLRELAVDWKAEFGSQPIRASVCFTHMHWDHIQGFPFFDAAFNPANQITIYGAKRPTGTIKELLSTQMQGDYFPIAMSAMNAQMEFHDTQREFMIDEVKVQTFDLPHPNGSLGYRLSAGDSVFVLATDSELDQVATNAEEIKQDFEAPRRYPDGFLDPMRNADLLLIDCQYADEEYRQKVGWGHNSIAAVVDLCVQVRPKMIALSHHDPLSMDDRVVSYVKEVIERLQSRGITDTLVTGARERMALAVTTPKRPLKL